jgi:arabinose-5-phosphate isomerase
MKQQVIATAREVLEVEAKAVAAMTGALDDSFVAAVELMLGCTTAVLTTGVGKAGHIARKVSATLASTGTPSHYLSPSDAVHGDLGSVRDGDIVLVFSASGETDEILRLVSLLKRLNHRVISITSSAANSLGRSSDVTVKTGKITEACPLGLAPSASTTAMLALGDALALAVMHQRKFTREDFAMFHPAGQLGRKLLRVGEAMTYRKDFDNLPVAADSSTVGDVLRTVSRITRRPGATALVSADGKLSGIFTDGDLRRLLETETHPMSVPIARVMTRNPKRIKADQLASEAMAIMRQYRIDELPVVDADDAPVGMIDVQDLVLLKMLDG